RGESSMRKTRMLRRLAVGAAFVAAAVGSTAVRAEMTEDQAMIERMKIEDLLGRSGAAFDTRDVEGWLNTFTADGALVTQYQVCRGREALHAYMTGGMNCLNTAGGSAVPDAPAR